MSKVTLIAAVVAAGLLVQTQAFAGYYAGGGVAARDAQEAYGAIVAGNAAADKVTEISCYLGSYVQNADVTNAAPTSVTLTCQAADTRGTTYCYVNNPPNIWIRMVSAINPTSYISFFADSQHHCQGLTIQQGSQFY